MQYILLILTTFFIISTLNAQPIHNSNKARLLRIGTMDLPPYGWRDTHGNEHGIIFEMNNEIGKRLGVPYENKILPFKRMLKLLKNGKIDLISAQAHKGALVAGEKLAVQFDIDIIAGTRKGSSIKKIADFKGKHLVYHRSASYSELEGLPERISYVNGYDQALGFLYKKRHADAAIFSEPAYYYWMKKMNLDSKDFGKVLLIVANKKQWIFVREGLDKELKAKIKTIVSSIYKEKLYEEMLKKYGKH